MGSAQDHFIYNFSYEFCDTLCADKKFQQFLCTYRMQHPFFSVYVKKSLTLHPNGCQHVIFRLRGLFVTYFASSSPKPRSKMRLAPSSSSLLSTYFPIAL